MQLKISIVTKENSGVTASYLEVMKNQSIWRAENDYTL
jgi:hypothetical protein